MLNLGPNPVVVTAHPDDEVLFAAGIILRHPALDWTVICCSIPRRDPIRAWKYFDACKALGAKAKLFPAIETEPSEPLRGLRLIDLSGYSAIVTHNENGEYNSLHHRGVHEFVVDTYPDNLKLFFGYGMEGAHPLELSSTELAAKAKALRAYNHQSPLDEKPKADALVDRYFSGNWGNLGHESYFGYGDLASGARLRRVL